MKQLLYASPILPLISLSSFDAIFFIFSLLTSVIQNSIHNTNKVQNGCSVQIFYQKDNKIENAPTDWKKSNSIVMFCLMRKFEQVVFFRMRKRTRNTSHVYDACPIKKRRLKNCTNCYKLVNSYSGEYYLLLNLHKNYISFFISAFY